MLSGFFSSASANRATFPRVPLDSIKGGFVDAKFNRTLNQANDIITRLSQMAIINARVSYTTLAWGNRMATGPYAKDKQAILDEIDRQLVDLKASASVRLMPGAPSNLLCFPI
jgi:hypothetical protein